MTFNQPDVNFSLLLPFVWLILWSLVLMFIDLWVPDNKKGTTGWLSLVGIIPPMFLCWNQWNNGGSSFNNTVVVDNYATFLNVLYLLTALISILIALAYMRSAGIARGELYFLMLFSVSGMMLMGMANDLILVFLALELLSIPLYILSGFNQQRPESEESALKYFLLGAFASGFLVFGIALIYGATGSTYLPLIAERIGQGNVLGMAGIAMLLVGFGFKIGAVPFHMWTPDVYEGAPTAVTAFMSVGAKLAGFAALIRVFAEGFVAVNTAWVPALAVLSAITMIVGNIAAIGQQNIKRMLAFSSIAHAGYILMAVVATIGSTEGVSAAVYYMMVYLFSNLGAFALISAMEKNEGKQGLMLDDYKGLAKQNLPMAMILAYFMFSLMGLPLTAGFTGKFYVFRSAIEAGFVWLAVVAALTSVVSAFYYLRVVFNSFMHDGSADLRERRISFSLGLALAITVIATVVLGFYPGPWYELARQAVSQAVVIASH